MGFDTLRAFHNESRFEAVRYGVEDAEFRHINCARASGSESIVASSFKSLFGHSVTRKELRITSRRRSRIPVSATANSISSPARIV
jgi:diketogulonate reductase-like aldo/keto reductase